MTSSLSRQGRSTTSSSIRRPMESGTSTSTASMLPLTLASARPSRLSVDRASVKRWPTTAACARAYQVRGLSSYLVPKIHVEVAATFQSKPGALLAANYAAPNAIVVASLGRQLSGNAANVTVNLIAPGSLYGDRINQLDLRFARVLRNGRFRTTFGVDIYNTMNSSAVLSYDNTFVPGGPWLQPLTILTPRFVKITAALDW
jgi:hypothetical protein